MTPSESLQVSITGDIWWGGFTAELAITNTSDQTLESWTLSSTSPHQLDPNAWGVALESERLENGLTRYTLTGTDWGSRIAAGATIKVGFNGTQGIELGRDGDLTEGMLFSESGLAFSDNSTSDSGSTMSMDETSTAEASTSEASMGTADMNTAGHDHSTHQHTAAAGPYTDINSWGSFHGSNHNST